ncbi:MAG TPA: DUF1294 domain-containing protein [Bacteroidia bacterium]
MSKLQLLIYYCIAINCFAYCCMCIDKYRSMNKGRRIPENTLFFFALVLGATGIYLGMQSPVRHKSAKTKFKWGIPLLLLLNVVIVYWFITNL